VRQLRIIATAIMTAGLLASAAFGQEETAHQIPLVRLFPHWQDYLELPADDRSQFTLAYRLHSNQGVAAEDIQVSYAAEEISGALALDTHGRVLNPPDTTLIAANPIATINQPPNTMGMNLSFEARFDDSTRIDPHDAVAALQQANHAMRQVGGVASLFVPAFKTVIFVFEGPAPEAWAVRNSGERTPLTVQEDRVIYRPNDRNMRDVSEVILGRAPDFIQLDS
jgi:hypothetical protein